MSEWTDFDDAAPPEGVAVVVEKNYCGTKYYGIPYLAPDKWRIDICDDEGYCPSVCCWRIATEEDRARYWRIK